MKLAGGCECGAVRYESTGEPLFSGHCHCDSCRRASGTGHGTVVAVPGDGFTVEGTLSHFEHVADSGKPVSRFFCPTCGISLYTVAETLPGAIIIRVGNLDDPEAVAPQATVYAKRALSWDPVAAGLPAFDEMPPPPA